MKILAAIILAAFVMVGCQSNPHLPYQYATMVAIEQERISAEDALRWIARARAILEADHTVDLADLQDAINWGDMQPSTRLLVSSLLADLELDTEVGTPLPDVDIQGLLARLDAIEQAVRMSQ